MIIALFIALMGYFCLTDIKHYTISNWIILPAIIIGCILTGFWLETIIMFILGALLFNREKLGGGDVKLMALTGAFLGLMALPAFILSRCFVWFYRIIKKENGILPYAPFISMGCIPFLWIR